MPFPIYKPRFSWHPTTLIPINIRNPSHNVTNKEILMELFNHPSAVRLKALSTRPNVHPDSKSCDFCGKVRRVRFNKDLSASLCSLRCRRLTISTNMKREIEVFHAIDDHGSQEEIASVVKEIKRIYSCAAERQQYELLNISLSVGDIVSG